MRTEKWCSGLTQRFILFCLHFALFVCTALIINKLESVYLSALCLHSVCTLSALCLHFVCTLSALCLHSACTMASFVSDLPFALVCDVCRDGGVYFQ